MKIEKVVLAFLLIMGVQSIQAQVSIGGIVGLNYSNLRIKHNINELDMSFPEMGNGYFVGLNSSFVISEKINLLGDLKYTIRGYAFKRLELWYRVSYFELAPKVEYRLSKFIGLALGVNFGIYDKGESRREERGWEKINRELDTFRSNLALTGTVRGHLKNFFVEVGYEYGIKNLSRREYFNDIGEPEGEFKNYFRTFNLGVGYLFAL